MMTLIASTLASICALPAPGDFPDFKCDHINGVSVAYVEGGSKPFRLTVTHDAFNLIGVPCSDSIFIIVSGPTATASWGTAGGWGGCVNVQAGVDSFDFDVNPQLSLFYLRHYFSGSPNKFGCGLTYGPFMNVGTAFKPYGEIDDGVTANFMTLIGAGGSGQPSTLEASGAPAGAVGLFAVSVAPSSTALAGGTAYVDLQWAAIILSTANAEGRAVLPYAVDPALVGTTVFAQAAFADAAKPAGIALSHGLEILL